MLTDYLSTKDRLERMDDVGRLCDEVLGVVFVLFPRIDEKPVEASHGARFGLIFRAKINGGRKRDFDPFDYWEWTHSTGT